MDNLVPIFLISVYITPPVKIEGMNTEEPLIPHSCRLRHLTYCAEAQVEVVRTVSLVNEETRQEEPFKQPDEAIIHMGKIPVMVKSMLCTLSLQQKEFEKNNENAQHGAQQDVTAFGECPFDQVFYVAIYSVICDLEPYPCSNLFLSLRPI